MPFAILPDRATIAIAGPDAENFLQNLVTADIPTIEPDSLRTSALLTPQGKILFDFLVSRTTEGFRLECAAEYVADLVKRLTLYKLRAKATLSAEDDSVAAVWDEPEFRGGVVDLRFPTGEAQRVYGTRPEGLVEASLEDYRSFRLGSGVAELGLDFPPSEMFPHDVLLDQNAGVSFRKGCFVGQEVVSRMQHRGTARRRLMLVDAERHLTPGANLKAGDTAIGTILSASGSAGMAMVRIDKLAAALARDAALSADGVPVSVTIPPWAGYDLPSVPAGTTENPEGAA